MTHTVFNPTFGLFGFVHVIEVTDPHNPADSVYWISSLTEPSSFWDAGEDDCADMLSHLYETWRHGFNVQDPTRMMTGARVVPLPTITVRYLESSGNYVADGPDGHVGLISRISEEAARRDGLAYFLQTRKVGEDGRWVAR